MNFELKDIFPALGVVLGWLLHEISQAFRDRSENKRLINKSLYSLLEFLFILEQKKELLRSAISAPDFASKYYDIVQKLYKEQKLSSADFTEKLKRTVQNISAIDPILGQEFGIYGESAHLFDELKTCDSNADDMLKELELRRSVLKVFTQQIDHMIKGLLLRYNIILLLRYLLFRKKNFSEGKSAWEPLFKEQSGMR